MHLKLVGEWPEQLFFSTSRIEVTPWAARFWWVSLVYESVFTMISEWYLILDHSENRLFDKNYCGWLVTVDSGARCLPFLWSVWWKSTETSSRHCKQGKTVLKLCQCTAGAWRTGVTSARLCTGTQITYRTLSVLCATTEQLFKTLHITNKCPVCIYEWSLIESTELYIGGYL